MNVNPIRNLMAFSAALASGLKGIFGPGEDLHPLPRVRHATAGRRSRIPGPARPAGSKLARKASEGSLTKVHGGMAPAMTMRFPFSAKRRTAS